MSEVLGAGADDSRLPVFIPQELYSSDFTCRPEVGATRLPGTDDYVELGQPQIEAVDSCLLNTPEQVSRDVVRLESWKKFDALSKKLDLSEGLDETVLSRLFVIAEHVGPIVKATLKANQKAGGRRIWQNELLEATLTNTGWLKDVIANPMIDAEVAANIVDYVAEMKTTKKLEINIVRLAATIWFSKMNDSEYRMVQRDAPLMFTKLLEDEITLADAAIESAKRPEWALDAKRRAIQRISSYAFAGMPMAPDQVDIVASRCCA